MKKIILMKMFLSIFLITAIFGCATTSGVKEASTTDDAAIITNLQILDNKLVITSNKHFTYTVYSASDPYKTTIEIPDIALGNFTDKIASDKGGITEIIPRQTESPKKAVQLDVIFQNPSTVVPIYKDNTLTLAIKQEEPVVKAEAGETPVVLTEVKEEPAAPDSSPMPKVEEPPGPAGDIPSVSKATEITSIEVQKSADAVKILIIGNGAMTPNVFPIDERIVVDIPDVSMKADLPSGVISPLKGIRAGKHRDKARLVLDLKEKTNYDVTAIGSSIVISLQRSDVVPAQQPSEESVKKTVSVQEPEKLVEGKYAGKRISLDFQDADIIPIFRLLADISGYNIVVNPDVKGKITLKLINVPWDQALDLILRTFSLSKIADGNIIRIVPTSIVAKELDELARAKKAEAEAGELKTKIFPVNYADLNKLKDAIDKAKVVSSRGSLTLDERGSTIIVNDLDPNLEKIDALIREIDQEHMQARQVLIEARIVEVTSTYTKDLGIQWGGFFKNPPTEGDNNFTIGKEGRASTGTPNDFLVNLPASSTMAQIGFGYINRAATFALDLKLSAMEQLLKGKVISNPKIMTMNNEEAKITQGSTIYIESTVAGATTPSFTAVDAVLSLSVKPRIAPGGAIFMDLDITNDEPGPLIGTNVTIRKKTAKTSVLVNNGDTIVIGGIFKKSENSTDDSVPGLSKIPLLGRLLFNREKNVEDNTEILMFITPRIVEFNASR
ncbi:MAG: type IV pilus secretin PilQ [Nitrospirota bacterium]